MNTVILSESQVDRLVKKLLNESGIRNINNLLLRYKKAKIYFHQDLDGVTTAIAMRDYLEDQGFQVVDCEVIQYGEKEWAIKKPDAEGEVMPVLVDFAHGKVMFEIHTDHHDTQSGVEGHTSTSFKEAKSNVETISQIISPKEIFTNDDIFVISMVDSAKFVENKVTPKMVMNFVYNFDKDKSLRENKILFGLVTNKLLLAYKNYPDFMENLVMNAEASLISIYNNIKKLAVDRDYADVETMQKNQDEFIKQRGDENKGIKKLGNILVQYGLGKMKKGSYDRYVPFDIYPDADFLVTGIGAPVGMVQVSCNPYKENRALKGIDLGPIKDEVLEIFKPELEKEILSYRVIKKIAEREATEKSVGFTQRDMIAMYGKAPSYDPVTNSVNAYDFLKKNSGGHKCITNISAINYVYSGYDKPYTKDLPKETLPIANYEGDNSFVKELKSKLLKFRSLSEKQVSAGLNQIKKEGGVTDSMEQFEVKRTSSDLVKDFQNKFIEILQNKISGGQNMNEIEHKLKKKVKESNSNVKFGTSGDLGKTPGIHIYLFDDKKIGYSNLLNFEDSWDLDSDIPMFYKNSEFCKKKCEDEFFNSKNSLYLYDLKVHPDYRGNGYGESLMEKCHEIAKNMGFDYITLITNRNNEPAQNLYKKLGYDIHQSNGIKDFYYKKI